MESNSPMASSGSIMIVRATRENPEGQMEALEDAGDRESGSSNGLEGREVCGSHELTGHQRESFCILALRLPPSESKAMGDPLKQRFPPGQSQSYSVSRSTFHLPLERTRETREFPFLHLFHSQ